MKTSLTKPRYAAFTLIEMIGVLAVIAILASLLIPKILNAINDAKINNTVLSYNTMKTAVMDHYGKYGSFTTTTNGASIVQGTSPSSPGNGAYGLGDFDLVLLNEGLIDKPFYVKVGNNSYVHVVTNSLPTWDLSGAGNNDLSAAQVLVEAVIQGTSYQDSKDI